MLTIESFQCDNEILNCPNLEENVTRYICIPNFKSHKWVTNFEKRVSDNDIDFL